MKKPYKILIFLTSILLFFLLLLNFQTFKYPTAKELDKRVNYLEKIVTEPLDLNSDVLSLGMQSAEFMLFTYSYSAYSLTNLAARDSTFRQRAVCLIKSAILKTLDDKISFPYNIDIQQLTSDTIPDYSVLYLGHLNLMLGCYRLLSNDNYFDFLNDNISKSLFERYNRTEFLNLESYQSAIWLPDNTVAIASLKLHSANTGSDYNSICAKWVDYAKKHYLDKKTGVLFSTVDAQTGVAVEEPRGSMLAWSIFFIYQFDESFATELYFNYKKHFSNNYLIVRLFKERYKNNETSTGDIDSGIIFCGYSIPANEFALSNAILAKDFRTAKQLERLVEIGARKIDKNNEIKYKVRFIDLNVSPMAEALLLSSLTATKWTN